MAEQREKGIEWKPSGRRADQVGHLSSTQDRPPRPSDSANAKTEELLGWLSSFKKSSDILHEKQQLTLERERCIQTIKSQNPQNFEYKLKEMEKQQQIQSQYNTGKEMIKRLNQSKLKDFDDFVTGTRKDLNPASGQASLRPPTKGKDPETKIDQGILDLLRPISLPPLRS